MHQVGIRDEIVKRVMARRGKFHLFDHFDPARTAVIIIDMQGTFCEPGAPAEVPLSRSIVEPINRLNDAMRAAGGHVIWVNHANVSTEAGTDWAAFFKNFVSNDIRDRTIHSLEPGGSGQEVWSEMTVQENDIRILKNRYSALIPGSSPLERVLRNFGIDTLLITGTKTNICCESTARDAMMMDFDVVMVSDGTAALSDDEHRATLETIIQQFGDVFSVDEIVERLKPAGGTESEG